MNTHLANAANMVPPAPPAPPLPPPRPPPRPRPAISNAALDALRTERDTLRTERDALRTERDALHTEMDPVRTERDTLRAERDTLRTEREALRTQLDPLRAENDHLHTHLDAHSHWPSLSHMAVPPADPAADPTGLLPDSLRVIPGRPRIERRPEEAGGDKEASNIDIEVIRNFRKYERFAHGLIEADDGEQVLDHDGGTWYYDKMVGQGGFGCVARFVKVDALGNVIDVSLFV